MNRANRLPAHQVLPDVSLSFAECSQRSWPWLRFDNLQRQQAATALAHETH
jgi:hypothetical protein